MINAYKLPATGQEDYPNTRASSQCAFRQQLYIQLFQHSQHNYVKKSKKPPPYIECIKAVEPSLHRLYNSHIQASCRSCSFLGRTATTVRKRKALQDLSPNTTLNGQRRAKAPRTRMKCEKCEIAVCEECEEDHRAEVLRKIHCIWIT